MKCGKRLIAGVFAAVLSLGLTACSSVKFEPTETSIFIQKDRKVVSAEIESFDNSAYADSPRYKALGNSIALPPWKWLLKRLCGNYERDATMASLFDGIGGFPLIWEQLNRRGTCLWASEIEEFPMAVTRRRFGTAEVLGDMGRFLYPCGEREKL